MTTVIAENGRTGADLVRAITEMSELITATVAQSATLRRTPDAVIDALHQCGATRMSWPRDRGGAQLPMTQQHQVLKTLGRHDGSLAWITAIWSATPRKVYLFGASVFDEFLNSETPYAAGVFAPTGTAAPSAGGYRVTGKWSFCTAQHHSGYVFVPTGAQPDSTQLAFLIPRSAFTIHNDWDTTGLKGTGSHSLSLNECFVPADHAIPFANILNGIRHTPDATPDDRYYLQPMVPIICALSTGPAIGMAEAAADLFRRTIHTRGITYSAHTRQADAPSTHQQLAAVDNLLFQADNHARRIAETIDNHVATATPWDMKTRQRCRNDAAQAVKLSYDACQIIAHAAGASSRRTTHPLAAIFSDIDTLSVHSFLLDTTATEEWGRVLAGKAPVLPIY